MKRQLIITATLLAGLLMISGCGDTNDNRDDLNNNDINNNGLQQQNIDGNWMNNRDGYQMNDRNGFRATDRNRMNDTDNTAQRDEVEIAEEAAEKVAQLDFVRSAYVLKTANNAFVAAMLENEGEMSRHMEDQVAQAVRSIDHSVENVYVSTNPSFIDRVDQYIDDVRQGRPVEGFVEQFGEMIDRLFPNAR